ncbi:hypothetical protein LEP48_05100 [Isoptericola sp. NEAU-Y5]|uniref:Uncharacterized protein n=1 Tax=Isoptericola luteus TaxID=2879484 RepID=A0ABS7ZG01_9MICO|nr:hypothetical protein [Isoptericola sp. NEAU-Y5]MCA5892730.1 hypothetical protein [Isoptericola sp. NEAU-Y5]
MHQLSRTNVLTVLVVIAGIGAAVGYALSSPELGGAALGGGMAFGALLIHSAAREQRLAHERTRKLAAASKGSFAQLEASVKEIATHTDQVVRAQRKTARVATAQGDRVEQRTDAMTRRIIADINAARLEAADRFAAASD